MPMIKTHDNGSQRRSGNEEPNRFWRLHTMDIEFPTEGYKLEQASRKTGV